MAVATDIAQELSKIKPAAAQLQKDAEDQKNKIQNLVNDMTKALKDNNRPMIERDLKTLETLRMAPYAGLLADTNKLLAELKGLEPEDGSEDLKQVNALTNSLGELQGKLERNFARLKTLEDAANKALAQGAQDGSKAADQWAAFEDEVNRQLQAAKTRRAAMQEAENLANEAVKAGDQNDLDAAKKAADKRATWKPNATEVLADWATFYRQSTAGLSKELQDQFTRDRTRFQKIVLEIVQLNKEMDDAVKRIQAKTMAAAKPEPVDVKALKHALGLDKYPKIEDDLKAALKVEGSARSKALDGIEKKFNFKFKPDNRAKLMAAKKQ
jgi:hypothetical protein